MTFPLALLVVLVQASRVEESPYAAWKRGPPAEPGFFPLAVWLQDPANAPRFQEAGINLFVGLWKGPTEKQLAALKAAGMRVVFEQNDVGLAHVDDDAIVGWMHGDEPDNAQPDGKGGYGPPIPPEEVVEAYERMRAADPSRPVLLNLGQGVAVDDWIGRGARRNHPEDYARYLRGCDIASFDLYPVVHEAKEVAGKLWLVPAGVERLRAWSKGERLVWNCVECSRVSNVERKPTAQQIKAEVWMSIVHGSRGIVYFVHQFEPRFVEASLLSDEPLLAGVTAINREIQSLAPALNGRAAPVNVTSSNGGVPVAATARAREGATYVFAVGMREGATEATFSVAGERAEVIGEDRSIPIRGGAFRDAFGPYAVHLYRIR
ncbi:MAG TPA: hypothetical protein VFI25_07165 [Planctomycetota bacterium]|nr:hypothetical protein [Planctomycetota bacterium]